MATIKSYTDIEQSKALAKILPLESADMYYFNNLPVPKVGYSVEVEKLYNKTNIDYIPCWSLAALLEQLPYELCDDDGNLSYLQINKEDDVYQLVYEDPYGDFESIETDRYGHFVDACYKMIIRINELNLL